MDGGEKSFVYISRVPVLQTDTGSQEEDSKAIGRSVVKELGKLTPMVLLDCDTIELKPEVRQMCAADTCHKYDKCWSCPLMN